MSKETDVAKKGPLALVKEEVVDKVEERVAEMVRKGALHIPADYSAENAMKSAWLTLVETKDRDKKPVLTSCTRASIANALLDMVVQALSPAKNQCYFIAYGDQLVCQRSYFGTMAVCKRVMPNIDEIISQVVYKGDELVYSIVKGKRIISEHKQALGNIDNDNIIGAYAMIIDKNGDIRHTEVMSWQEILQSWKQSQVKPVLQDGTLKADSTHAKYPGEMAKRTVINRACKAIINSSSDAVLLESFNRASEVSTDEEVAGEIAEFANQDFLDIPAETVEKEPEKPGKEEKPGQQTLDGME